MTVAAVIPTYNAAAFIESTLASVFAQTRRPEEVIVVDDASSDDTAAIARRLGTRVIVLPNNSGGPAKPLNTGMAATNCDYIATLDHDDRWRPDWLEQATKGCETANVALAVGRVNLQPANPAAQAELDARWNQLRETAKTINNRTAMLDCHQAYNQLVPHLNYAVTCSNMVFLKRISIFFDTRVRHCCDYRFMQDVTMREAIALVDTVSCDWVVAPASLYQRGNLDALDRDLFLAYRQFERVLLDRPTRIILKEKCRRIANDLAYAARQRGHYRCAALDYLRGLLYGGMNRTALLGIAKLPFFALGWRK